MSFYEENCLLVGTSAKINWSGLRKRKINLGIRFNNWCKEKYLKMTVSSNGNSTLSHANYDNRLSSLSKFPSISFNKIFTEKISLIQRFAES